MNFTHPTCPLCGAIKSTRDTLLKQEQELLLCSVCGLFFTYPLNLPDGIYDQNYYKAWGMENGVLPDHVFRLKEETMRKHLGDIKSFFGKGVILEVGSAVGCFLKVAQEEGFNVKGIEVSEKACEIARSLVGNENVFNGTLENVDIKPGSIDVLFMSDVIEHIPEPLPFLKRAFNLVKKGGIVYLTTPDPTHWSRQIFRGNWVHYKDEHLMFFSRQTFDWIADYFGLYLFDFSPAHKYANLRYLKSQLNHFDYKVIGAIVGLVHQILPKGFCEYLIPISLGESRCVIYKPSR